MHVLHDVRRTAMDDLGVVSWSARVSRVGWRFLTISPAIERMLGYPRSAWRTSAVWLERVHEADRGRVAAFFTETARAPRGLSSTCEYRMYDASGSTHWVRTSARRPRGRPRIVTGALLDITDEHRGLEALALCTTHLRFVSRTGGMQSWESPSECDRAIASPQLAALAGFDPARPPTDAEWLARIHPRDRDRFVRCVGEWTVSPQSGTAPRARSHALNFRVRHSDNSLRWLNTIMTRAEDRGGAGPWILGAAADVTDRMHTMSWLRMTEQLHRQIWDSISAMAAVLDNHGSIVEVNRAWMEVAHDAGRVDGFVGASYLDATRRAAIEGDRTAAAALEGITRVLRKDLDEFSLDYTFQRPGESETRWFRLRVLPLQRPSRGAIVMHDDITDGVAAEWRDKQHRDDLTHMQRLATLGELATSIAHELNQPLTTIMAAASTARRALRDAPDEDLVKGIVKDILEAVARAAEVVRRARTMVRGDDPVFERLAVNDIVSGVARLVSSDLVIRQVDLTLDLDPTVTVVLGDRVQLQQMLLNLLLNAMDAVSELPLAARRIFIRTRPGGNGRVEMVVRDTGHGIPEGLRDRVFEPFVTTKRQGTGLGLAIVRAIVQAHGGQVWLETPEEGGAAFRVELPVC